MPEPLEPDEGRPSRTADERKADHDAIERLSAELLPALMAKLAATGRWASWRSARAPGGSVSAGLPKAPRPERRPATASAATVAAGTPRPSPRVIHRLAQA